MKHLATLALMILLSWSASQAQAPLFKYHPSKKKVIKTSKSKKPGKKKLSPGKPRKKNTKITDRYRSKMNYLKRSKHHPRSKARIRRKVK